MSVVGGRGVVAPEFACVARTEAVASFLEFSERSCLTFLLRRWEGRQVEERKGRGIWAMSRVSRSFWWASVSAGVGFGIVLSFPGLGGWNDAKGC